MLRSHVIKAVFWRNLASYFSGVLGYLFIVVFVVACSVTAFSPRFFTNNLATLDLLSISFPMLLLFIVPAVTMTSWAEERRQGTDELLFTLPATDFEILLGKYLSMLAVYTIALAFSGFNLFVLEVWADPDRGLLFTTYVGYWLAGGALLAAGMFASVLTNSMTVAFVLGVVVCIVPVFGDKLAYFSVEAVPFAWVLGIALIATAVAIQFLLTTPNRASVFSLAGVGGFLCLSSLVWFVVKVSGGKFQFAPADFAPFGLGEQLRDFGLGLITLSSLVYFVSLTSFLLYLNSILIGKRHWSGGREGATMGMQFVVRSVSLAVALVSLNVLVVKLSEAFPLNVDVTTEQLYTLSPSTRDLIKKISKDRPVKIQAFISADVPREQVMVQTRLKGLLRQYDRAGGSLLDVRFVDVAPFTPEAEEARLLGVQPMMVFTDEDGRRGTQEVFMGVVVSSPVDEVVVPVFEAGTPIEYELTRSIRTVANETRLTVGMLTTDAKVAGGLDMQSFRQTPEWRIQTELKKQYKVEQVPADMPIDEKKYDVLMAVWPSSLNTQQLQNLVTYVKNGNPTLIFDDPLPYFDGQGQNAPRLPKPRAGGMFGGMNQPPEQKADDGKLTSLLRVLEIAWDNGQVVFDLAGVNLHPEFAGQISPELVFISPKTGNPSAIHQTSPVTSGLQEVLAFFPGEIQQRKGSELKFEALLRTRGERKSGVLQWEEITRQSGNPFGGGGIEIQQDPPRVLTEDAYTIAAHITGKDSKDRKGIKAIFVADADIISNQLFALEASQQLPNLRIDNIKFVLNCVDVLAGETSYIDLRKRRAQLRNLTVIQDVSNKLREDQTKERGLAESEAKDQFEKAQKRLDDAVAEIEKDTSLTPIQRAQKIQIVRETEQRKSDVARATIEREKRQKMERIEAKTKRQIRAYEDQIRWWCIVLPPIPAVILGIIVLSSRINAEYRNVESDRLVKR